MGDRVSPIGKTLMKDETEKQKDPGGKAGKMKKKREREKKLAGLKPERRHPGYCLLD